MLTSIGKAAFETLGLRVRRSGLENRFDAMGDALRNMRSRGFVPTVVIDGGSNVGQWATLASGVFPEARFHLVEPQPGCWPHLESRFPAPRFALHKVVLTAPGLSEVRMVTARGAGDTPTSTYVERHVDDPAAPRLTFPASTLDALVLGGLTPQDRVLLKLDLEGHEIAALDGAAALLPRVDVIVSEVTFFDIHGSGHVTFSQLLRYLEDRGFELYDFAALAARRRDGRLRMGDAVFARRGTPLVADVAWA